MSSEDKEPGPGQDATLRDFRNDQKVFGRYTLIRILGRGGMGIVWLAHDDLLDRDVALKFLPEVIIHDRAVLEDLKQETKRSLELTHKNIIRIHDFVHDVISGCISMEYVEGDTLSNLRADKASKTFEPEEVKPWLRQLCEALDYAHNQARIIHRDLKPSNLMITQRGQLKIADFGIARSLSDSVSMLTHTRGTSGTLAYMSPQQLDGDRGTHLDDIYSLGATLYELLTSRPPFYSGDVSRQIHDRIPPSMMQRRADLGIEGNAIPKNWEETVAACLAKNPARRPQSVIEVATRLQLDLAARGVPAGKRKVLFVAATSLILIGAASLVWFWNSSIFRRPEKAANDLVLQKPLTVARPESSIANPPGGVATPGESQQQRAIVSPARPVFNTESRVVVFNYHRLVDNIKYPATEITPAAFEMQMNQLRERGVSVISLQDFLAWRRREKQIPLSSAVITFDDGWKSQYEVAWPIMKRFGYPFTMFIYTEGVAGGSLGGSQAITWEELAEMRDAGVDIEAHSATHQDLRKGHEIMLFVGGKRTRTILTGLAYEQWLKNEVIGCKQTIEERLRIHVNCFAIPYGFSDEHVKEIASSAGYEALFTVYGQNLTFTSPLDSCGRYPVEADKPNLFTAALTDIRVH